MIVVAKVGFLMILECDIGSHVLSELMAVIRCAHTNT